MKTVSEKSSVVCLPERRTYNDAELVTGMVKRDPHLVSAFFQAYGDRINQLVWQLLRSPDDHQDMVNAALVSIMQSIKKIRDPNKLPQWVSKVTMNAVRDEIRKKQVRRRFFVKLKHPEKHLPPNRAQPEDIDGRIFAVLRTMKPESQILFALHYVEGNTLKEIAQLLGRSISTVRRMKTHCRSEFMKRAARDLVLASYIEDIDENDCN